MSHTDRDTGLEVSQCSSAREIPGTGWQIVPYSDGNSKSPVSLGLTKSCKTYSSCPPFVFRAPLRTLLMKSLTPIQEIAAFAKHVLPCFQKSFWPCPVFSSAFGKYLSVLTVTSSQLGKKLWSQTCAQIIPGAAVTTGLSLPVVSTDRNS